MTTPAPVDDEAIEKALAHHASHQAEYLEELKKLVRIPSVSFEGFDKQQVRLSAEATCDLMRRKGLQKVQMLEMPGAHPYAYGEWTQAAGRPTLLLYAHHDVQPAGEKEKWNQSDPFEPVEREGRLFARGAADDKAGILVHIAAIDSWLKSHGALPVNVKMIVEGEEEAGSGSLPAFLKKHRKLLQADAIVLTDTSNFDTGLPSITTALRGIRTVPDMDTEEVQSKLIAALKKDPPFGVQVEVTPESTGGWWYTGTDAPAFKAARKALRDGYGKEPVSIGCGGSIPFVDPFSRELGGAPALLIGVEDPYTNAHSENESLHLGDFSKATHAAIRFYAELVRAG